MSSSTTPAALKAAILIVSTTAAQDPATDSADVTLRQVFEEQQHGSQWKVHESKIIPDDVVQIQKQIMLWTDKTSNGEEVNLIVTTGGTGFAVSDQTPEAVSALLHKEAPGLVHGMLAASLQVTPFAMMSRPVAGVRNGTVIITLPGSPKGARENLQAVIKMLPHACLQAAGANSRALHMGGVKRLEKEAGVEGGQGGERGHGHGDGHGHKHHGHGGHRGRGGGGGGGGGGGCGAHGHGDSHGHNHGHNHGALVRHTTPSSSSNPKSNDPTLGPSRRHRESPYPMLSVTEALSQIAQHTPSPQIVTAKVDSSLIGAVLAQDVSARENVPAFRASIVDGYAVVVPQDGNMRGVFPVVSVSHAAPGEDMPTLKEGEVARITTGAPLPPGATSVIMVEDTVLVSTEKTGEDGMEEEKEVEILAADKVHECENVREVGSDIKQGQLILGMGVQVSAVGGEIGLLAAVGVGEVQVYRRPVVGVLSTGDEIVDHDLAGDLRLGEVRDTNRPTLISAARAWGYEVVDLGVARDKAGTLEETLRQALRQVDVVITTGGVSMGELDLLKPTIERSLGGTIHFGRVAMKPGKPTTFATVPVKDNDGKRVSKVIFSLPGNPASALVTFHLFVLPSLHQLSGISSSGLPKVPVTLGHDVPLDRSRPEYHRAIVSVNRDGVLTAVSTGGQRSSMVGSMKGANALLALPSGPEPLRKGSKVEALLMGSLRSDM
ncbi:gephyrin [Copromyces sp. CBS 386.78]|nr:gephyrin [Copromyces sp. CBS 386.78]